jgi:crossover junction endodeoxyribonuclease RusA
MIILNLNYPPSVNTYWGFHGHRRYLTPKANQFKAHVSEQVIETCTPKLGKARIEMTITLCPPDKRIRDLDNNLKSLIDAVCQAGVFDDDEQIDVLMVQRGEIVKGGRAIVMIETLPPR